MIDFKHGVNLQPLDSTHEEKVREWRNHPEIWKYTRQNDLISDMAQIRWFKKQSEDPSIKMYAIEHSGMTVGVCGLTSLDWPNRRAEFSLYIEPKSQKHHLGTFALKTLLDHGFINLGLHQIWGETFQENPAQKLFQKLGFKLDGVRRDFYFKGGKFIDAYLFSLLSSEWNSVRPNRTDWLSISGKDPKAAAIALSSGTWPCTGTTIL